MPAIPHVDAYRRARLVNAAVSWSNVAPSVRDPLKTKMCYRLVCLSA